MSEPADDKRGRGDALSRKTTSSRDRANSRGDATRLRLLLVAEELFAERGIDIVPFRDIGIAAGQKNHAVVQYYFGNRETLVREIMAYRATISEVGRVERFADLVTHGLPDVGALVRVFILPLAAHFEDGNHYLGFMSRYIIERGGYLGLESADVPHATVDTLRTLLSRLLPDCPDEVLEERWTMMQTDTIHTLARYQVLMKQRALSSPIDALLEDLVRYHAAGIQADLGDGGHSARPDGMPRKSMRSPARRDPA